MKVGMGKLRSAVLYASTVAVCCPHCSAEQPAPDNGSDLWTPEQIHQNEGKRTCVSCDEPFRIAIFGNVQVDRAGWKPVKTEL